MKNATRSKTAIKLGIYFLATVLQMGSIVSLTLDGMSRTFPNASTETIQYVFLMASASNIIAFLVAGPLAARVPKKTLCIIFNIVLLAGALIGFFSRTSLLMQFVANFVIGLGFGVPTVLTFSLVTENFDGMERVTSVGLLGVFANVAGILCSLLAEVIMVVSWEYAYLTFLLIIPVTLIAYFLLPSGPLEKPEKGENSKFMNGYMWNLVFKSIFVGIGLMAFWANISFSMVETSVGDGATAGIMNSAFLGGMILIGALITPFAKLMKSRSAWMGFLFMTAALMLFWIAKDEALFIAASVLLGMGYGAVIYIVVSEIPEHVGPKVVSLSIGIFTTVVTVGVLLNPYIITTGAAAIFDEKASSRYLLAGIIMTVVLIITFFTDKAVWKKVVVK